MSNVSETGNVADITVEILKDIREEIRGVRQEVGGLREEVGGLREEVGGLREEVGGLREEVGSLNARVDVLTEHTAALTEHTVAGFASVNHRLDSVLRIAGTHHLQLETRVTRIEDHLGLKTD